MPVPLQEMSFLVPSLNAKVPENCVVLPFKTRMLAQGELAKPSKGNLSENHIQNLGISPTKLQVAVNTSATKKDERVNTKCTTLFPGALATGLFIIVMFCSLLNLTSAVKMKHFIIFDEIGQLAAGMTYSTSS
jgi:hypothetical protein